MENRGLEEAKVRGPAGASRRSSSIRVTDVTSVAPISGSHPEFSLTALPPEASTVLGRHRTVRKVPFVTPSFPAGSEACLVNDKIPSLSLGTHGAQSGDKAHSRTHSPEGRSREQ